MEFLVTKGDEISFLEANKSHGLSAAFEKVPDLLANLAETHRKSKEMEMDKAVDTDRSHCKARAVLYPE